MEFAGTGTDESATNPNQSARPAVLAVLPDDERRMLEPVIDSPGITQIALRDRSDFSKSKVSQTVSGLEKRGLLYRERQGRTYGVYPSDGSSSPIRSAMSLVRSGAFEYRRRERS